MPHPKRALLAPEPGDRVACFSMLAVAHSGNRRSGGKGRGGGQEGKVKSRVADAAAGGLSRNMNKTRFQYNTRTLCVGRRRSPPRREAAARR